MKLLGCPHSMAAGFSRRKRSKGREGGSCGVFMPQLGALLPGSCGLPFTQCSLYSREGASENLWTHVMPPVGPEG